MASVLESSAAFESRAASCGLSEAEINILKAQGVTTLAKLAFAITTPGSNPSEDNLRSLINSSDPHAVVVGTVSALRRLMFDAQTLAVQHLKSQVEGGESSKKELVPAERAERIRKQKQKLIGYDLTGPLECSHSSYDLVLEMAEKDAIFYLQPHKFGTRSAEVSKDRPPKELVIDAQHLKVSEGKHSDKVAILSEFDLSQALTRRSLACDLIGICSFSCMERWHRFLFNHLTSAPPPNFSKPTMEQILRADRQAWIKLAERVTSLKRSVTGDLPLDTELQNLESDSSINFHLLPMPVGKTKQPKPPKPDKPPKGGKGKGKGKAPKELLGLHHNTDEGERVCFNFNMKHGCKYAKPGSSCKRGKHVCMKCFGDHPQMKCRKDTE